MSKPARMVLLVGIVLSTLIVLWLVGQHSRSGSAVRKYKAQLIAQGEKLTFADLTRSRATNLSGSLTAIANAVSAIHAQSPVPTPGTINLRVYVAPGLARPAWMTDPPGANTALPMGRQWTWEDLASVCAAAKPAFDGLRVAMKDPDADAGPFVQIWGVGRVDFVAIRTAAQWLMGASLVEVRQGHLEEALQNLEAIIGMVRMERDEFTMVAQMIRVALTSMGTSTTWELLQAPGWSEAQLERMQKAWEGVDLLDAAEKGVLGERAFGQEFWIQARNPTNRVIWRGPGATGGGRQNLETMLGDYVLFPAYKLTSMDNDELFHLRSMQEALEALRLMKEHRPWQETRVGLDKVFARVNQINSSPQRFRYMLSLISIPNGSRAADNAVRAETERQLTVAGVAVRRFQMRHRRFPSNLEELVPEFLAAEPYDPMSGKALRYRLKSDSGFVLYSVGEDGIDNGGDATPTAGKKPGLWEGLDAVWPAAAPAK
jgi:hypothetical protein